MADKNNDRLAEVLDACGLGKYAWEPAPTCPQGHEQWSFDYETRTVSWSCQPGEVCLACVEEAYDGLPHIDRMNIRGGMDCYRELTAIRDSFGPAEHPEWRIGRVARNLSNPTNVLLVLEAFADARQIIDVAPHFHRNTEKRGKVRWNYTRARLLAVKPSLENSREAGPHGDTRCSTRLSLR